VLFRSPLGASPPENNPPFFAGNLDLSVEISDRWQGSNETYPPNRVEYQIRRLRSARPSVLVTSNVLFDATQIPFRQINGENPNQNCEIFSEIDHYASHSDLSLYRFAPFSDREKQTFLYAITQNSPVKPANNAFTAPQWITPHIGPWRTDRCDSAGNFLTPNGVYEITVRASDIFGNSSIEKRRIRIKNLKCGVE